MMYTLMPPCPQCGAEGAHIFKTGLSREAHGESFEESWCECSVCGASYGLDDLLEQDDA